MSDEEINAMADRIAVKLLADGDDPAIGRKAYRLQYKLGEYGSEVSGSGLNRIGLKLALAKFLKEEFVAGSIR
jgi:hypothetical protein